MILVLLNFPKDLIFSVGEREAGNKIKKQTHWALSCRNPFHNMLVNLNKMKRSKYGVVYRHKFMSRETLDFYTTDLIKYYRQGLLQKKTFDEEDRKLRVKVLDDFLVLYKPRFKETSISPPFIDRESNEESVESSSSSL